MSRAEVLKGKSGKSRTTNPNANRSPNGERLLVKASTDYGMYHPVTKHGQLELIPVSIKVYNLDWDELLPVLKDAYPNQKFPENVRRFSASSIMSMCADLGAWGSRWGSRITTRFSYLESLQR